MKLFRLVSGNHVSALDGEGARLYGGRWNSKGTALIYASSSRALAMAEVLVQLRFEQIPTNYKMLEIEIREPIKLKKVTLGKLPTGWNNVSSYSMATQRIGDLFCSKAEHLLLGVPSAIVKGDWNYLINPHHPDARKIKIVGMDDFPFDGRLFGGKAR